MYIEQIFIADWVSEQYWFIILSNIQIEKQFLYFSGFIFTTIICIYEYTIKLIPIIYLYINIINRIFLQLVFFRLLLFFNPNQKPCSGSKRMLLLHISRGILDFSVGTISKFANKWKMNSFAAMRAYLLPRNRKT